MTMKRFDFIIHFSRLSIQTGLSAFGLRKRLMLMSIMVVTLVVEAKAEEYRLASPDGRVVTNIVAKDGVVTYAVEYEGEKLLLPSAVGLDFVQGGKRFNRLTVKGVTKRMVDQMIVEPSCRQSVLKASCNELRLEMKEGVAVVFRAYNEGVAYRYEWKGKPGRVNKEGVEYVFARDWPARVPYVMQFDSTDREVQYCTSFENQYKTLRLTEMDPRRLCFLPLLVEADRGVKVCITESALLDYPGLYLHGTGESGRLEGEHAPLPKRVEQGGWGRLQLVVKEREEYIAEMDKGKVMPWRIMMVAPDSKSLAMNNMSYLLAEPSRVNDQSWIKPGKSAWEWWNSWNIGGVKFEAGINNETYKHYINFAATYGLEYIVMDEGWSVGNEADLFKVVPELDLPMLVEYAEKMGVGIILWAGYYSFARDMERVCKHYSEMGIKGFKIDFMNRDDQLAVDFYRQAAEMCAKYHLVVDFHGAFKPAGFTRTYPNVLNFEGVFGLEQMRWAGLEWDQMQYDVEIPFIRQTSGPMDYTPGAMLNGARGAYRPNGMEPMSQGTRCHQLALYVVLDAPLTMLCDSPTNYEDEPTFTRFMARIPTMWDETRVLQGEVGEYIVTARRKGKTWYVGGITNWEARDIELDLGELGACSSVELYSDGTNAHRRGSDYYYKAMNVPSAPMKIHMAPGGGFVAKIGL